MLYQRSNGIARQHIGDHLLLIDGFGAKLIRVNQYTQRGKQKEAGFSLYP